MRNQGNQQRLIASCLILLCTLLSCSSSLRIPLGFNMPSPAGSSQADYQRVADPQLGAEWVRISAPEWPWGPQNGDWSIWDTEFSKARAAGLRVLAVCLGSTSAANGGHAYDTEGDKFPPLPAYVDQFAAYCAEFAKRGADAIEVWNEPNIPPFWSSTLDDSAIALYGSMLVKSYQAIKAVNTAVTVISAGLAPYGDMATTDPLLAVRAPLNYLSKLLTVPDVNTSFDGIGWHPYCFPSCDPRSSPESWNAFEQMHTAYNKLVSAGRADASIWATEFGSPAASVGMTEADQAVLLQQYLEAFDAMAATGVNFGPRFIFKLQDTAGAGGDISGPDFGIFYMNGTDKPAVTALVDYVASHTETLSSPSTNGTLSFPLLGVSYAQPSDGNVKTLTDQMNSQLFDAGMNAIFWSVDWKTLETSPGVFSLAPLAAVVNAVNLVNSVKPTTLYLLIKTLDTTLVQVPADLASSTFDIKAGLFWNDTVLVSRFFAMMDAVLVWLKSNTNTVFFISIGNEVDVWLASHPTQQKPYASFVSQVIAHSRTQYPQMAFGVTVTYDGGVTKRFTPGFEWVDSLMSASDAIVVTYYPLTSSFFMKDPAGTAADIDNLFVYVEPSKKVIMQEIGYASGYEPTPSDGSSLLKQRDFVAAFYNATLSHLSRFALLNYFWLVDAPASIDYGITNPQFLEYLETLGVIRSDGTAKPAFYQLLASLGEIRNAPLVSQSSSSTTLATPSESTTSTATTTPTTTTAAASLSSSASLTPSVTSASLPPSVSSTPTESSNNSPSLSTTSLSSPPTESSTSPSATIPSTRQATTPSPKKKNSRTLSTPVLAAIICAAAVLFAIIIAVVASIVYFAAVRPETRRSYELMLQ